MNHKKYLDINQKAWDTKTPIHLKSKFYNNDEFKKGKCSLNSFELNALGDINGKTILHLQCHFGQDSISLVRKGAIVTAVDFSSVAIKEAKKISNEINVPVNFIESSVLELNLNKKFDIIFSSYGTIGWLPDLNQWAKTISKHLKKGGTFVLTEFHPFIDLLDPAQYDYFYKKIPDVEIEKGTYTDGGEDIEIKTCWWNHSLTEIFGALESNELKLKLFEEFDYSPYKLRGFKETEKGKFVLQEREKQKLPYVFNLKATTR